jgi:apolipoprotein N-acyltransferase
MGDYRDGGPSGGLRAGAALLSGVLYAAAQPGVGVWPLAPVCLVPLLLAWRGARLRRRLALAWLTGSSATLLATAAAGAAGAARFYGLSLPAAIAVSLAVGQVFGAGSFLLFAVLAGDPARSGPVAGPARIAGALALAELARATLLTGFPWLLLAYSLLPAPALAQLASVSGAIGVSFALALANGALAELAAARSAAGVRGGALAATAALLLVGGGAASVPPEGVTGSAWPAAAQRRPGVLRMRLVQHAPPVERRGAPAELVPGLERLRTLTRADPDFDLAVWSENALPALLPDNAHLLRDLLPADGRSRALLLGAPRSEADRPGVLHTSAFLVDGDGRILAFHDKVHLLPFAEYAPWPLSAKSLGLVETTPGATPRPLPFEGTLLGPLVCYEVLFPSLARRLVRQGAGVLVNLSNDGWFGATGAAEQHLAAAMYRAIETRRPLLRATHTGVTAAFDARGREVASLARGVPGALVVDVVPGSGATLYGRLGDAPLAALALALTSFPLLRRRSRRR